jgi:hypothetical protein
MVDPAMSDQGMIATHLLEVLLLAVQKLPPTEKAEHRVIILGVAEMLGDLIRACPPLERDGLLGDAIYALFESATQRREPRNPSVVASPSETEH